MHFFPCIVWTTGVYNFCEIPLSFMFPWRYPARPLMFGFPKNSLSLCLHILFLVTPWPVLSLINLIWFTCSEPCPGTRWYNSLTLLGWYNWTPASSIWMLGIEIYEIPASIFVSARPWAQNSMILTRVETNIQISLGARPTNCNLGAGLEQGETQ